MPGQQRGGGVELDCNSVIDSEFEECMNNWRRTVIYSGRHNNSCVWWAEMYAGLQRLAGRLALYRSIE